jgi:cytochrome c oxidase cbb3-type subunit I
MRENRVLTKFFSTSVLFFIWVTVQGTLQAQRPVHDFIAQGPAGIINGAHVHVGTLGWVSLALMGALYYLVPLVSGNALSWSRLVNWVFWSFTASVVLMAVLMIAAGIAGGQAFQAGTTGADLGAVMAPYMIALSLVSIIAGLVAIAFSVQILHTALKKSPAKIEQPRVHSDLPSSAYEVKTPAA